MNRAILLIGHGSQDPEGAEGFRQMAKAMAERMREREERVDYCFLEFAEPDIQTEVDRLTHQGVSRITAVPVMLLDAGHAMADIPAELARARQRHPTIRFDYGEHLGFHPKLMQVLLKQLTAVGEAPENLNDHTLILMVGRGSSDPVANSNFYKWARMLWERTGYRAVDSAFIGITRPTLPEGLDRAVTSGAKNVVVLPYFLFTGTLYKRIAETVSTYQARYPTIQFRLTRYFGLEPLLLDVVAERVEEALVGRASAYADDWMRPLAEIRYGPRRRSSSQGSLGHGHHHGQGPHRHEHADGDHSSELG